MDLILDFVKKYQKLLLLTFVMLIVLFIGTNVVKGQKRSLTNVDNQIAQLKSQKLMKDNAPDAGGLSSLEGSSVGQVVDEERLAADEKIMEDFCKRAFTFKSLDDYMSVRKDIIIDYKLNANSDFFRYFYQVVADGDTASRYEYLPVKDGKYQMTYKSMSSYVVYMHGTEYSYVNDVIVVDGDNQEYHLNIACTVNGNGEIVGLMGYTSK